MRGQSAIRQCGKPRRVPESLDGDERFVVVPPRAGQVSAVVVGAAFPLIELSKQRGEPMRVGVGNVGPGVAGVVDEVGGAVGGEDGQVIASAGRVRVMLWSAAAGSASAVQ